MSGSTGNGAPRVRCCCSATASAGGCKPSSDSSVSGTSKVTTPGSLSRTRTLQCTGHDTLQPEVIARALRSSLTPKAEPLARATFRTSIRGSLSLPAHVLYVGRTVWKLVVRSLLPVERLSALGWDFPWARTAAKPTRPPRAAVGYPKCPLWPLPPPGGGGAGRCADKSLNRNKFGQEFPE